MAEETDYDNFLSKVANHQCDARAAYENSLHDAWKMMHKLQETERLHTVSAKQIDAILPFLDRFEAEGFSAGIWDASKGQMPNFNLDKAVMEFLQSLYKNGWVIPAFDWTKWQQSAQEFVDSLHKIEKADSATILKLFTTHVRKDRFCEGHLAAMFENGHIAQLLRRLRELRESQAKEA